MTTTVVLSDTDRRVLLDVAADVIGDAVARRDPRMPHPSDFDGRLREPGASFVTLERGDQLLGCIGSLVAVEPLVVDVARHALAAAFADPRLPPVTRNDFEEMSIKVSVLTRPEPWPRRRSTSWSRPFAPVSTVSWSKPGGIGRRCSRRCGATSPTPSSSSACCGRKPAWLAERGRLT